MKSLLGAAVAAALVMTLAGCAGPESDPGPVLLLGDAPRDWTYEGTDVYVVNVRRDLDEITPAFRPTSRWPEGKHPQLVAPAPLQCHVRLGPVQTNRYSQDSELGFRIPVTRWERAVVVGFKVQWVDQPTTQVAYRGPTGCD